MKILGNVNLENYLFFDIETARGAETLLDMEEAMAEQWHERSLKKYGEDEDSSETFKKRAGLYAEFAKVVCIAYGYIVKDEIKVKTVSGEDERALLVEFCKDLNTFKKPLCGYNHIGFDVPFLVKRLVKHQIEIPIRLYNPTLKPWEKEDIDLMLVWAVDAFKGEKVSLDLLCTFLGIPSPKDGVDGSSVAKMFHEGKYADIANYCSGDVVATANVARVLNYEPVIGKVVRA